jgi:hypothetical protein
VRRTTCPGALGSTSSTERSGPRPPPFRNGRLVEYDSSRARNGGSRLFGEDGFEKVVAEVAGLEGRLGIEDLARFAPKD